MDDLDALRQARKSPPACGLARTPRCWISRGIFTK